jgi:sugar (pentulose or hexulose) kinase
VREGNSVAEAVAVLDVGKTHAKLSLVGADGAVSALASRANESPVVAGRPVLDAEAIEAWALAQLAALRARVAVAAIVPVGHGAAAALIDGDDLAAPVMDYEAQPPDDLARAYDAERDPFALTGSPRLPLGLNLGLQLFWQERLYADLWPRTQALLWPQYWAFRLSGERAAEVSSLGCHTDLWRPDAGGYSDLANRRGWASRFPAPRHSGDVL